MTVLDYYEALGFTEMEVDEGLTALFYEFAVDGDYALVTDDDGALPDSLERGIIFACYSAEGAYRWSASFKNAHEFQAIWSQPIALEAKLTLIQKHREDNEL